MKNEILVTNNVVATLKNTLAEFNSLLKSENFEIISREFIEDGYLQLIYRLEGRAVFWEGERGISETLRNLATKKFFDNGGYYGVPSCRCDDFIVAMTSDNTLVVTYFG